LVEFSFEKKCEALMVVLSKNGIRIINWDSEAELLQARINSLRAWGNTDMPDLTDEILVKTALEWLPEYSTRIKALEDFKMIKAVEVLKNYLTWEQIRIIDKYAPSTLKVPSGSDIKLTYFENGRQPVLSVRLQELFGMIETPKVNEGKTNVIIQLLSPGYKPVQVPSDLKSFWSNTYPHIKKELKVRYSKHFWPEDPLTATAVKGVKKKQKN
jgi:ATP-dependent helicase HrpB